MEKLPHLLLEHLKEQGSSLSTLNDACVKFLSRFEAEGLGRTFRLLVDITRDEVLYFSAAGIFLANPQGLIQEPYRIFINRTDEGFKHLCARHKWPREGSTLSLEQSMPMKDAHGNLYFVTRHLWPVLYDTVSDTLIIALEYHYHTPWSLDSSPIPFKPMLLVNDEPHDGFEDELCQNAMHHTPQDLKIKSEWMPVVLCHYHGVDPRETGLIPDTINYYNRELLKIFRQFSNTFETAKAGVLFLKRQGWHLVPLPKKTTR